MTDLSDENNLFIGEADKKVCQYTCACILCGVQTCVCIHVRN